MLTTIKRTFKQLSFRDKFRVLIGGIIIVFAIFSLIIILVWRRVLAQQTYESAYNQTIMNSQSLYSHFAEVEQLTYRAIDDDDLQRELKSANAEDLSEEERNQLKRSLYSRVSQLTRNSSNINNSYLLNTKDDNFANFMNNSRNVLLDLSVNDISNKLSDSPAKGVWFFSDSLSQAVYARKIFETSGPTLNFLGTIIFVVDTSFITEELNSNPNYSEDFFFFINYSDNFHHTLQQKEDKDALLPELREQLLMGSNTFTHFNYQGTSYYVTIANHEAFNFIYLISDKNILKDLVRIQTILLAALGLVLLILLQLIDRFTNQLTRPITELAGKMATIPHTKRLEDLTPISVPDQQNDEIVILYNSHNAMVNEINQLITDNYKMKILSQEIEFVALQAQLNPHFLYNTLDSINWLALANNQQEISEMVTALALLFRKKIDTSSPNTTLQEELELIEAYVTIQKIRFRERVEFLSLILVEDLSHQIPKLTIQPLIENAFKYAVEKMTGSCQIILKIEKQAELLVISVTDNGPGFEANLNQKSQYGIGLKNIKERLALYYGDDAKLTIHSQAYKETTVSIWIPLTERKEDEHDKTHTDRR
ncbi:sensor histidine kinase [Enterococcus sp. CWB-B31]|uniref:sensor histidine kinase n=1 Tax=Enterococcus sp. CWB-B31 TaxID=2885159 RepID=UPI001E2B8D7F|nr:histidine kinase [Enterococcus sp. CWB-B31]MCB5953784.1 histidine kinase [Enterococcus sp. CWB-B31]